VTAKGLEFAFGSVLDMWRFQQLETYDGHEQGCRVFKSFPTAGKPRANIYEIPPISLSASGFGSHLVIEWRRDTIQYRIPLRPAASQVEATTSLGGTE
jgi:hypothetical protein